MILANNSAGNVSAYVYAFTFYVVPHGLLAVSIMTTMTPNLARRARAGDIDGLRREFGLGLRYIVVLVLPASVLFAVLAQPMLAVIVRHQFTAHDAVVTADTLQAFAISLVPFSVYLYVMRAFYALQDTRTPFVLNAFENGAERRARDRAVPALRCPGPRAGVERRVLRRRGRRARRSCAGGSAASPTRPRCDRRCGPASPRWPLAARRGSDRGRDRALVARRRVPRDRGRGRRRAGRLRASASWLLRSDELTSLVGLLRRRGATASGV